MHDSMTTMYKALGVYVRPIGSSSLAARRSISQRSTAASCRGAGMIRETWRSASGAAERRR